MISRISSKLVVCRRKKWSFPCWWRERSDHSHVAGAKEVIIPMLLARKKWSFPCWWRERSDHSHVAGAKEVIIPMLLARKKWSFLCCWRERSDHSHVAGAKEVIIPMLLARRMHITLQSNVTFSTSCSEYIVSFNLRNNLCLDSEVSTPAHPKQNAASFVSHAHHCDSPECMTLAQRVWTALKWSKTCWKCAL